MGLNWVYNGAELTEVPEKCIGFVYEITNLTDDRKYIGKKFFQFTKTKQVKLKKKKVKVESDWKDYYGSNDELKSDVERIGKENFKREILHLCYTKGECGYLEAKEQFGRDVILTKRYYNNWISCRVTGTHVKNLMKD